jgi:hypothetical protein
MYVYVIYIKGQSQSRYDRRQSVSLSLFLALIWGPWPGFCYCQTVEGLLMWSALSDEKTGMKFIIASSPRQRSHLWVRVPQDSWPYITVSIWDSWNLEGQVPEFISTRNRVAQLYTQTLLLYLFHWIIQYSHHSSPNKSKQYYNYSSYLWLWAGKPRSRSSNPGIKYRAVRC